MGEEVWEYCSGEVDDENSDCISVMCSMRLEVSKLNRLIYFSRTLDVRRSCLKNVHHT